MEGEQHSNFQLLQSDHFSSDTQKQMFKGVLEKVFLKFLGKYLLKHPAEVHFIESFRLPENVIENVSTTDVFRGVFQNFEDGYCNSYKWLLLG